MVYEMESGMESEANEVENEAVEAGNVRVVEAVESVVVETVTLVVVSVAAEGVEGVTEEFEAATEVVEVIEEVEDVSIVSVVLEECSVHLEEDQVLGDGPSRRPRCRSQKQDALLCGSRVECRQEGQDRKDGGLQRQQRQRSE